MSTPSPVSMNVGASPAVTGGNALKALQPGASETGDTASEGTVAFTLDDTGSAPGTDDLATMLTGISKGTHPPSDSAANHRDRPGESTRKTGAEDNLLSILQGIVVASTVIVTVTPSSSAQPVSVQGGAAGSQGAAADAVAASAVAAGVTDPGRAPASSKNSTLLTGVSSLLPDLTPQPNATSPSSSAPSSAVIEMETATTDATDSTSKSPQSSQALPLTASGQPSLQTVIPAAPQGAVSSEQAVGVGALDAMIKAVKSSRQEMKSAVPAAAATASANASVADDSAGASSTPAVSTSASMPDPGSIAGAMPGSIPMVAQGVAPAATQTAAPLVTPGEMAAPDAGSAATVSPVTAAAQSSSRLRSDRASSGGPSVNAEQASKGTVVRSSSLFDVLAQTLSDTAASNPDSKPAAQQAQVTLPAALSSLLQQINDGTQRKDSPSSTPVSATVPSDIQLAGAASTVAALPAGAATPTHTAMSADSTGASSSVQVPLDTTQQNWPDALGSRVEWLLHQGLQEAHIELHPHDMGSINVHIKLGNDGADVRFAATNANVRDALASSMPKLREMLAGSGLQLAQAQVGSQMQQQESSGRFLPQQNQAQAARSTSGAASSVDPQPKADAPRVRVASVSIIDDYA